VFLIIGLVVLLALSALLLYIFFYRRKRKQERQERPTIEELINRDAKRKELGWEGVREIKDSGCSHPPLVEDATMGNAGKEMEIETDIRAINDVIGEVTSSDGSGETNGCGRGSQSSEYEYEEESPMKKKKKKRRGMRTSLAPN
jgi:hypothetical protein